MRVAAGSVGFVFVPQNEPRSTIISCEVLADPGPQAVVSDALLPERLLRSTQVGRVRLMGARFGLYIAAFESLDRMSPACARDIG
jgi:hypothetical protein